jgi:predicted murein hydrolase (TIGR00659 family)
MTPAAIARVVLWTAATVGAYRLARWIAARWRIRWAPPLIVAPALLAVALLGAGVPYREYASGAGWLVTMLGPATVAFAIPIYEQRALIQRHWAALLVGGVAGSLTSMTTSWWLATALHVDGPLRTSLVPRSTSTPFAMEVSARIGGIPELTAIFVVVTGVLGATLGELLLARLPLRSPVARGALMGGGAHAVGTAKAYEIGKTEGAVSALVMVLVGVLNVAGAPIVAWVLR